MSTTSEVAADVIFNGLVTDTYTIVGTPGALNVNTQFNVLASDIGAGSSGGAAVVARANGFSVTVAKPTAFGGGTTGDGTNVSWTSTYAATGATTVASTDADTTPLFAVNPGVTNVSVDVAATKAAGSFYTVGNYLATATVTCAVA